MRVCCNTCSGVYETVGADGLQYFHHCPPITVAVVDRGAGPIGVLPADVKPGEAVLELLSVERKDVRNENVVLVPQVDGPAMSAPIAPGLGVTAAPKTPIVIQGIPGI